MTEKLTEGVIKALAPPRRGSRLIWDTELTGFALRLFAPTKMHPKGARTFVLSYWHDGIERRVRIGAWPDWSVTAARAKARKLRQRIDCSEEVASGRHARREASTLADLGAHKQEPRNLIARHHAITDNDHPVLANHTVGSLLSLMMTGDWQNQAQGNPYKRVKLNLSVEQDLTRVLSPVEIALACDLQMRGVWEELTRQRRDGSFVYPARSTWWQQLLHPIGASSAEIARERQGEAMLELFDEALACQLHHLATTTRRQAEQQRDHYLEKAHELKRDALTMVANPECDAAKRDERWRRLQEAAETYTDYAHEISTAAMRTALDRKHDGRARWVALSIANKSHELFGRGMYGLTAIIVSVVLGRTVTLRRVRQWCHPADSGQKNGP
jgi:hypothetical protein